MHWWHVWTQLLEATLTMLVTHVGLSEAASIILLTLTARAALMPVSLSAAVRMHRDKQTLERIRPRLEALREKFKGNRAELTAQTMALYREHDVGFIDRLSLLNMGSQALFGLGMFQTLKRAVYNSKFLWIPSLARPDVLLTIIVGALMLLAMGLMPGAMDNTSLLFMLLLPVVLSVVAVAALPSALGLYWATSNAVTLIQTLALRGILAKHGPVAARN